jgi:hypothetical protein
MELNCKYAHNLCSMTSVCLLRVPTNGALFRDYNRLDVTNFKIHHDHLCCSTPGETPAERHSRIVGWFKKGDFLGKEVLLVPINIRHKHW